MTDDDRAGQRLGALLRNVAPNFTPVDPAKVITTPDRRAPTRPVSRYAAGITVVLLVAAVAVGAYFLRHPSNAAAPQPAAASTLAAIAKAAPCRAPDTVPDLADQSKTARFTPIAVVECEYDNLPIRGDGTWAVLIRQVSTSDLNRLKAGFSQPDKKTPPPKTTKNTGCSLVAYPPVPFYFADADGHYLRPHTPSDYCGAPLPNTISLLPGIEWRTVSITKLHRTQADPAPTSFDPCPDDVRSDVQQAHIINPDAALPFTHQAAGRLTACSYDSLDDSGDGRGTELLFLTPRHYRDVVAALGGPVPSAGSRCPTQNSFAVIHDTHGHTLTVELGGCWRVAAGNGQPAIVGTANPKEITALLAPTVSGTR